MLRNCDYCQQLYKAKPSELKRGHGRYCSRLCARHARPRKHKEPNTICAYCDTRFWRKPSATSRSGLAFCCRSHKDLAQRLGSGIPIQPPHYGDGAHIKYRKLALATLGAICQDCGWDRYPEVLEVHHIDGDRTRNTIDNLRVVCPTCHMIRHRLKSPP